MKILILCTGNSCRSQMAEAYLKSINDRMIVYSAGTSPSDAVHPMAIEVMQEIGLDISKNKPHSVNDYLGDAFDYVVTVCDEAKESCPVFTGEVEQQIHISFADPAEAKGSEDFIRSEFKRIRDEIMHDFKKFNEIIPF